MNERTEELFMDEAKRQIRDMKTELARLRKIEAAAKALITWPTGKKFFAEYWDNLLEALEQK